MNEEPKKPETRSESISNSVISNKSQDKVQLEEKKDQMDIENNPTLTTEQKEDILKQEAITQEIVKDIEYATFDKNEKSNDFEEIKGFLAKKNKLGQWKEWYFCVLGNSLCYYESAKLNKKEGEIEIGKIKTVGALMSKKKKNKGKKFMINLEKNQLKLKAKNSEESQKLFGYLNYVVQMYQINNI